MNPNKPLPWEGAIGVLCGGPSSEREISIRSGQAVFAALQSRGLSAQLITLSAQESEAIRETEALGFDAADPALKISCAFIALHGSFGEDGTVQALLEKRGIPFTGSSSEASRNAMVKTFARRQWLTQQIPVPKWILANAQNQRPLSQEIGFSLMVKPLSQGSSIGMSLVHTPEDLPAAVEKTTPYGDEFILEEYVTGAELTVGILEDQALPVIQIIPKRPFYDYIAKYTPGMTEYLLPAPIPSEIARQVQAMALQAHQLLGCRSFSRADFILHAERGPILLELNTIPGMTATSLLPKAAQHAGIPFEELCCRMLYSCVLL